MSMLPLNIAHLIAPCSTLRTFQKGEVYMTFNFVSVPRSYGGWLEA